MKRLLWLIALAPSAQACELPGGAAQRIQSSGHTVVFRATPRVGEHFGLEFAVCPAPE